MKISWILFVFILFYSCNGGEKGQTNEKNTNTDNHLKLLAAQANFLYEQSKYSEAVKYFDSLISIDSGDGRYYFERGFSYGMLLKKNKAREDFKKAIKFNYKINHSYYNLGLSYSFENDSLALYNFEKCIAADPGYSKAYSEILDCKKRLDEQKMRPK